MTLLALVLLAAVPAKVPAALLLDGAEGTAGLRAWLQAASARAPALQPQTVSQDLSRMVGVDLLAPDAQAAAGLAPAGQRVVAFGDSAVGLSAPVGDAAKARASFQRWLAAAGTPREVKGVRLAGDGGRTRALAWVGSARVLAASGRGAVALLARLKAPPLSGKAVAKALSDHAGPAVLWVADSAASAGLVLRLDGSATGLEGTGTWLANARGPLLAGDAPGEAACGRGALLCARVGPGPALREAAAALAQRLVGGLAARDQLAPVLARALGAARGRALLRIDALEVDRLAYEEDLPSAFSGVLASEAREAAVGDGVRISEPREGCLRGTANEIWAAAPCADAPALGGPAAQTPLVLTFDAPGLGRTLQRMSPLDAIRGPMAAAALGAALLWGPLLTGSGALTAEGRALPDGSAAVHVRWPLQGK